MRPSHSFGILSSVALFGVTALSSTTAFAAGPPTVATLNVKYVKADLNDPAAAAELYRRIQRAARIVCEQPFGSEVEHFQQFYRCYDRAVDAAVTKVDASALTTVHRRKTQHLAQG